MRISDWSSDVCSSDLLDGNLIGGAADAAGTHLDFRLHIVQGLVEDPHRVIAPALANAVERDVDDAFHNGFLAVVPQAGYALAENEFVEHRIGRHSTFCGATR